MSEKLKGLLVMMCGIVFLCFACMRIKAAAETAAAQTQTQIQNIEKAAFTSGVTVGLVLAKYKIAEDPQEKALWLSVLDAMKQRGMVLDQSFIDEMIKAADKPEQKR